MYSQTFRPNPECQEYLHNNKDFIAMLPWDLQTYPLRSLPQEIYFFPGATVEPVRDQTPICPQLDTWNTRGRDFVWRNYRDQLRFHNNSSKDRAQYDELLNPSQSREWWDLGFQRGRAEIK